jgi:hypothetical protein
VGRDSPEVNLEGEMGISRQPTCSCRSGQTSSPIIPASPSGTAGARGETTLVTTPEQRRALKHARAPSRPGTNGGALAESSGPTSCISAPDTIPKSASTWLHGFTWLSKPRVQPRIYRLYRTTCHTRHEPRGPPGYEGLFPVRNVIISYEGHGAGYRTLLAS